jgi:polyisoprenoid-binding protein YceI
MRLDSPFRMDGLPVRRAPRLAILLLLAANSLFGQVRIYRIGPAAGSRFVLEVFKTGLMSGKKHLLVFERYQGRLEYDATNPERSRVELTIESASLVVQDDWVNENERKKIADEALNKQLRAGQYPEIHFSSASIRGREGPGRYEVQGDLMIRDVTKPVAVQVTLREQGENLIFEGEAVVKMKDYGMKPPSAVLGLIGTKNEMTVRFQLEATPPGP